MSTPASTHRGGRTDRFATELRLVRYTRTRDPAERTWLVMRYMPLARQLAQRYRNTSESREDLAQVAAIGLIHAIERYDPARCTPFASFAVPTIRGELLRHLRDHGSAVHVPRGTRELADRLTTVAAELTAELGRHPTTSDLARRLGRPVEDVCEARAALACRAVASLEQPVGRDRDTLLDILEGGDGGVPQAEARVLVGELIAGLPSRDRTVLCLRFRHQLTQREIGQLMGVSQTHVSRILRDSLAALRAAAEARQSEGRCRS